MIILYDIGETTFTSLGIGILNDTISCIVNEGLNSEYELELEYPITGKYYKELKHKRIILTKPNMHDSPQPFRIYKISRPINGRVIIYAEHISYDTSGITILPLTGSNLQDTFTKINNSKAINSPFTLVKGSDKNDVVAPFNVSIPSSLRSLLSGSEGSIIDVYRGEYKFDRFNIYLFNKRGLDRGLSIKYGKNLIDLNYETDSQKQYSGIYPYYNRTVTETTTIPTKYYQKVYPLAGKTEYYSDWLSLNADGSLPLIPIVEDSTPVDVHNKVTGNLVTYKKAIKPSTLSSKTRVNAYIRTGEPEHSATWLSLTSGGAALTPTVNTLYTIKTSGDRLNKVYIWTGTSFKLDPLFEIYEVYVVKSTTPLNSNWLSLIQNGTALTPKTFTIYKVIDDTATDYLNKKYVFNGTKYVEYLGNEGFYYIPDPIPEAVMIDTSNTVVTERHEYQDIKTDTNNGVILLDGHENDEPKRILTLDLTDIFEELPSKEILEEKARLYLDNNDLTELVETLEVSFIKLSDTTEYSNIKDLERVELGDFVTVVYDELGVNKKLQVIHTAYNVLTDRYEEIELGTKSVNLVDNTIQTGDNISQLANDSQYTDKLDVANIVAKTITAESANIKQAIIDDLSVRKLKVEGLIEASQATIDSVVARLLTADNADIKNVLSAGEVVVKGVIYADSGIIGNCRIEDGKLILSTSISIENDLEGSLKTYFHVDNEGNVEANSIEIIGGGINLGSGNFTVDNDGNVVIKKGSIDIGGNFKVTTTGNVEANSIDITGGSISIGENFHVDNEGNVNISGGSISLGEVNDGEEEKVNFYVGPDGTVNANQVIITGGQLDVDSIDSTNIYVEKIETVDIKAQKILLGEGVEIKQVKSVTNNPGEIITETQTVSVTRATAIGRMGADEQSTRITVNIILDKDVWHQQTFDVTVSYSVRIQDAAGSNILTTTIPVTVAANTNGGSASRTVYYSNIMILSTSSSPARVTETNTTDLPPTTEVVNNLIAVIDGTMYNLAGEGGAITAEKEVILSDEQPDSPSETSNTLWFKPIYNNIPASASLFNLIPEDNNTEKIIPDEINHDIIIEYENSNDIIIEYENSNDIIVENETQYTDITLDE